MCSMIYGHARPRERGVPAMGARDPGSHPVYGRGVLLLLPVRDAAGYMRRVGGRADVWAPAVFISHDGDVDPLGVAGPAAAG